MCEAARLKLLEQPKRVFMRPGSGQALPQLRPGLAFSRAGRQAAVLRLWGDPHAALRLTPGEPAG